MESKYYSFLVRLWESEDKDRSAWHISLESPESGEKQYFASLDDLLEYFEMLMNVPSVSRGGTPGKHS